MGMGRTWYQAHARARVLELWSGKMQRTFQVDHTESGIGDTRAEQAARLGLVRELIERLYAPEDERSGRAAVGRY